MRLGIDLGTGSAKALLLGSDGDVAGEGRAAYPVNAPRPGWAETRPQDWWIAVVRAVRQAAGPHADEVGAIGLAGQMHGVVLTAETGEPLRPAVLWADTRGASVLQHYAALTSAERDALANPITAGMAGPSLLWLKRHEPGLYEAARWALQPKDWLRMRLTGEAATDPSDASGTLLYDVIGDNWAYEILESLGLRGELLAPVKPSASVAGTLTAAAASDLGLPSGLPVAVGAADTAAAAIGSGLGDGDSQLTVGSGAQVISLSAQPVPKPRYGIHLYRTAQLQGYYAMAAVQNAGLALEWVLEALGLGWQEAYELAATVPPGSDGLLFLPYLTGERTPHLNPDACGSWHGLRHHHGRAQLVRSALEGVAFAVADGLGALTAAGITSATIRLASGGTQEPLWRHLLADILQRPLVLSPVTNASARGAALLGGMAAGGYGELALQQNQQTIAAPRTEPNAPDPRLEEAYERFRGMYLLLYPEARP